MNPEINKHRCTHMHTDVLNAQMSVTISLVVHDWSLKLPFGFSTADWLSHSSKKLNTFCCATFVNMSLSHHVFRIQ